MAVESWLLIIALGAICGLIGQCIRSVVGVYKASVSEPKIAFDVSRLLLSLFIGVLSGALAAILAGDSPTIQVDHVLSLIAAGYAGADFIEGFVGRYLPK